MISRRTRYALELMLSVGRSYGKKPVPMAYLEGVPTEIVDQIALELEAAGLFVKSANPEAGYQLKLPPSRITVGSLIEALDDSSAVHPGEQHGDESSAVQIIMREVNDAVADVLNSTTLEDLIREAGRPS